MFRFICLCYICVALSCIQCNATSLKIPKEHKKQYQAEIYEVINTNIDINRKKVDAASIKARNIYQAFLKDKNQMKRNFDFCNELKDLIGEISTAEFYLYLNLINTTDKYISIKNLMPATDYAGTLSDFIRPYMKKNKIDCTKIDEQIAYNQTKVQEIIDIKVKIYTYSRKYEETKAQNFYKKNIETKLKSEPAEAIMDSIVNFLPFQRNVLYIGHPVVIQIFQDGFLADFAPGEYQYQSVIFVQDKDSRKLLAGDYFDPFLPIKFTGRHFTYTNIYGERRVVPIFNVCLSTAKSQVLPQIKDTFYFVKKPHWDASAVNNPWAIDHIELLNERRLYYSKWK
jgi:hypothetical protein